MDLGILTEDEYVEVLSQAEYTLASRSLLNFTEKLMGDFDASLFHRSYYRVLEKFARGDIKRLMISVPPQHGKSEGSSRKLPAYMLGLNPDLRIAIISHSSAFAHKFNRSIQRTIDSDEYRRIFPGTQIGEQRVATMSDNWIRTSTEFEIVRNKGSLITVGRGGGLTGNPADIIIMDDLYKDYAEANSPVVREGVWDYYVNVVKTRLHNNSQELIVFTRWHEDDLIGRISAVEHVIEVKNWKVLDMVPSTSWVKINFQGIKEDEATEFDPREKGAPLWAFKHSLESLESRRKLDEVRFQCLYQGNPRPKEGLLYDDFKVYESLPGSNKNASYTDTADAGTDFMCSICYQVGLDGLVYITDVLYTQQDMQTCERLIPIMFRRNDTKQALVESNAGGRYFAQKIQERYQEGKVGWFHQSKNKESRILTNSATVNTKIIMPVDWKERWPVFSSHVLNYKRLFKANKYHDGPDVLTGIAEREVMRRKVKVY